MTQGKKKSNFITQETVPDDHFVDTFGNGVNRKIQASKFFKQIRKNQQTFIYEDIADLQAANLEADPDDPVYVRVAETGFWLYQITSLAATAADIVMDNGTTATRIYEETAVIPLSDITSLSSLNTAALVDGQQFSVFEYVPGSGNGGGPLEWDSSRSKSDHDGVAVFSPTVPTPADWEVSAQRRDYRSGVGETDPGGNGCFVRPQAETFNTRNGGEDTFQIYVDASASGVETGSEGKPFSTLQSAATYIKSLGVFFKGDWQISISGGTYNESVIFSDISMEKPLTIFGPDVGGTPNVPTVLIDGTALGGNGITFSEVNAVIKDVKAANFSSGAGVRGEFCIIDYHNVHADNCEAGYYLSNRVSYSTRGGVISNCTKGIHELFNIVRNTDTPETVSLATGLQISNCTHGIFSKEQCTGHLDWTSITDCEYGVHFSRSCTANGSDCLIQRNTYGVVLQNGCSFVPLRIDWGIGTADANTTSNWVFVGESGFTYPNGEASIVSPQDGFTEHQKQYAINVANHTGTTAETVLATLGEYTQGSLRVEGTYLRVYVSGEITGGNDTVTLGLELGGSNIINLILPAINGGTFAADFWLNPLDSTNQTNTAEARVPVSPFIVATNNTRSLDFNSISTRDIQITATLANSLDGIEILQARAFTNDR